MTAASNI